MSQRVSCFWQSPCAVRGSWFRAEGQEHLLEGRRVRRRLFPGGELQKSRLSFRRGVAETPQVRDVPPFPQAGGDFQDRIFRHPVEEIIGLRVDQDRAAHPVRPDVVMGDPPEACLDPAEDDGRRLLEMTADQVGIGDHRAVGTAVVDPPGREVVLPASLSGGGAVRDQGIDAAARDAPEERRFAETA